MSKLSQFLHGLGAIIAKGEAAAGPDVAPALKQLGSALHSTADLVEQKAASAYLGPVFGVLVASVLNAATDSAAADLSPTGGEPTGALAGSEPIHGSS